MDFKICGYEVTLKRLQKFGERKLDENENL